MRVHFSAAQPCVLRLGGAALGFCGETDQFADLPQSPPILAEFLPADGNYFPLSFLLDDNFFQAPPDCTEVYRYDCGADLFAARFSARNTSFRLLAQRRVGNIFGTLFSWGGTQLCVEADGRLEAYPLPDGDCALDEAAIGAETFLSAFCRTARGGRLFLYNRRAECALAEEADSFHCGETLRVCADLQDIAGHRRERSFRAENGTLILTGSTLVSREGFDPARLPEKVLPFAFFQELAAGGDPADYLAPNLRERADMLRDYLGNFCRVKLPREIFYRTHGKVNAAALIYPAAKNLFDVRFFIADCDSGKIVNIRPVE